MAKMLFKLRFVPEDEAQDIRNLLNENEIDYYETSAGVMGISLPAIWLKNDAQLESARQLIDDYQERRAQNAREDFEKQKKDGTNKSIIDLFKQSPGQFIGYLLAIIAIIYFSVVLFFNLGS